MDTIEIRTSERGLFKRCPQRWWWVYVEKFKPYREPTPFWFGSAVHEGLAAWYQKGRNRGAYPALGFNKYLEGERNTLVTAGDDESEIEYVNARDLGTSMLTGYIEEYGIDSDWSVIATERTFQVSIKHPAGFMIRYVGTWDGVYRDRVTKEVWLMEHKTTASINGEHLGLDDQAGSYWAVADEILHKSGDLKKGEHIAGIMYNYLRKATKDGRAVNEEGLTTNNPHKSHYYAAFKLAGVPWTGKETIPVLEAVAREHEVVVYGDPSRDQPSEMYQRIPVYRAVAERRAQIQRIRDEALYMYNMRKKNPAYPVYKSVQQFGLTACARCEFFRLCQLDEQGDEMASEFKASMFHTWEPYGDHNG